MSGNKISQPDNPYKEGYTFLGWYLDDVLFDFDTIITKSIFLIANWEENELFTVIFNHQDSIDPMIEVVPYYENMKINRPPDPYKDGHVFLYWYYLDSNGEEINYDFDSLVTADITLYGKYVEVTTIYYIFDFDVTNNELNPKYFTNETENIPLYPPTSLGYEFEGWYTSFNFSGFPITEIDVSRKGPVYLYPKFNPLEFNIYSLIPYVVVPSTILYGDSIDITFNLPSDKILTSFKLNGVEQVEYVRNNIYNLTFNAYYSNDFLLDGDGNLLDLTISIEISYNEVTLGEFATTLLNKEVYAYTEGYVLGFLELEDDSHIIITDGSVIVFVENSVGETNAGDIIKFKAMSKYEGIIVAYGSDEPIVIEVVEESAEKPEIMELSLNDLENLNSNILDGKNIVKVTGYLSYFVEIEEDDNMVIISLEDGEESVDIMMMGESDSFDISIYDDKNVTIIIIVIEFGEGNYLSVFIGSDNLIKVNE